MSNINKDEEIARLERVIKTIDADHIKDIAEYKELLHSEKCAVSNLSGALAIKDAELAEAKKEIEALKAENKALFDKNEELRDKIAF